MLRKPEILAPAGSKESLIGAINSGANAVYLAGKRFGARAYANNFEDESLIEVIRYAHLRGVLVFVAINTVMYDDEIDDLLTYTDFLVKEGVDALIVQDLGVIDLLIRRYPNLDIHASTQVNTHSVEQVKWLKQIGVKRIVMARETSLDIIRTIKKHVDIEIEVFVHGALCVCYSGNCLMSSMIGGRSGNRGECAQPCRLAYSLYKNQQKISDQSYLLSTKDLMTIEHMDELIEAGVDSFKIEGRMRKPEYVIETVLSYRQAVDYYFDRKIFNLNQAIWQMKKVFNRDFTKGFLFDEKPRDLNHDLRPNHMGIPLGEVIDYQSGKVTIKLKENLSINDGYRIIGDNDYGNSVSRILKDGLHVTEAKEGDIIKLDVSEKVSIGSQVLKTLDHQLEKSLIPYLDENYKMIHIKGSVFAYVGQPFKLVINDGIHEVQVLSEAIIEPAHKQPVVEDQIYDQISKLGQTPFIFDTLNVKTDNQGFILIKMMNEVRRKALDELSAIRTQNKKDIVIQDLQFQKIDLEKQNLKWTIKAQTQSQYEIAKRLGFDVIYLENVNTCLDSKAIPVLKRIQMKKQEEIKGPTLIQDIGHLSEAKTYPLYTDSFFNVTNIYTIDLLHRQGVKRVTLSPEISIDRIKKMVPLFIKTFGYEPNLELEVYGKIDLMITKYCPIAKTFKTNPDCHLCEKNQYYLEDRMNARFPLVHDGNCNLRILHAKSLNLTAYIEELHHLGITCRIHLTVENEEETYRILQEVQTNPLKPIIPYNPKTMTYGRFIK